MLVTEPASDATPVPRIILLSIRFFASMSAPPSRPSRDCVSRSPLFSKAPYIRAEKTPTSILGTNTIITIRNRLYHPKPVSVPSNTMDKGVGSISALPRLVTPNTKPKSAPPFMPRTKAPIITGICTMVISSTPMGIYPIGESPSTSVIATNKAYSTILRVFILKVYPRLTII